jgi:hypothetical protein
MKKFSQGFHNIIPPPSFQFYPLIFFLHPQAESLQTTDPMDSPVFFHNSMAFHSIYKLKD